MFKFFQISRVKIWIVRWILPIINRFLKILSLKLVTLRTPNRDFTAFFVHLKKRGFYFQTIIDVGVGFGTPALYKANPNAQFYLIEPVPTAKNILESYAKKMNAIIFNVAAGAEENTIRFFVHEDVTGSSALPQLEGNFLDGDSVMVPVKRLDNLITGPLKRPCVLKIDTQGSELAVLSGASGILDQIDVILIEVSFHEFRQGAPEVHDIVIKMADLDFRCYEILEGHYRSVDNALAQVDMVFVRANSSLRAVKSFFSPEQAKQYLHSGLV